MSEKFIRVDEWVPKPEDNIITADGKLMIIPFDKIFKRSSLINNFIIKKDSYIKHSPELCHYINYFIKFYDYNNELLVSYAKLKYMIDNKKQKIGVKTFIRILYTILFTDSLKSKIIKMVEDNYYIDLSPKDNIKYNESLEFTEKHAKILMQISVSMKIMIPVMFHYLCTYGKNKQKKYIYQFYKDLFDIYEGDIDIYNKLYAPIWHKVYVSFMRNRRIWEQREIFGVIPLTKTDELLKDDIISETIFKYRFDKNIVNFNHVVLNKQLGYFISEKYDQNRIELSFTKDITGLSGLDKLEMNAAKTDESNIILSDINIKETIKRLQKKLKLKISKEEIEYYIRHMKITKFQSQLVFYFYAKYFGGYRDLNLLTRTQYVKLLIMLKKRLYFQGCVFLPQILTSNLEGRLNTRTIRNNKFLSKIESSPIYQNLMDNKYEILKDTDKSMLILNILSMLINSKFTFVDYEHPENLGEIIEINQDILSEELMNFINQF